MFNSFKIYKTSDEYQDIMLKIPHSIQTHSRRYLSLSTQDNFKVAIIGGTGSVGRAIALHLKQNRLVTKLAIYGTKRGEGLGLDLSHIDTPCEVTGNSGETGLHCALDDAHLVVITAGVPRKEGMTRNDLFKLNAKLVKRITEASAAVAPNSLIAVVTNPVNSLVPLVCETLSQVNTPKPRKVFGVTTIDAVRANSFVGELKRRDPRRIEVTVIGGHSEETIVPLLSQIYPASIKLNEKQCKNVTERIKNGGKEVIEYKKGNGSASLSVGYAVAKFCNSLLRGLSGEYNVVDTAYVKSDVVKSKYFANPLVLGKNGIEKNLCVPGLSCYEKSLLKEALPILKREVQLGESFVRGLVVNK